MLHFSVLTTNFRSTVEGFHRAFCISSYFKSQFDFYGDVIFQSTLYYKIKWTALQSFCPPYSRLLLLR